LSVVEDIGTFRVGVISADTKRTTESEGKYLGGTDTEVLKHGEQIGLETRVVHAVNDECCICVYSGCLTTKTCEKKYVCKLTR
jgi:hypothetical protein